MWISLIFVLFEILASVGLFPFQNLGVFCCQLLESQISSKISLNTYTGFSFSSHYWTLLIWIMNLPLLSLKHLKLRSFFKSIFSLLFRLYQLYCFDPKFTDSIFCHFHLPLSPPVSFLFLLLKCSVLWFLLGFSL